MQNKTMSPELVWNWTGPFVWTDVILQYLSEMYDVDWRTLVNLQRPKLFGDIYLLPIPAFSPKPPGVGDKYGLGSETRINHYFKASWMKDVLQN